MNVVVLPATTAQQQAAWVSLLDLYDRIASYLRSIGSPEDSF